MENNSKVVPISIAGKYTETRYTGDFTFRGLLTRRQVMFADQVRRQVLGPGGESALQNMQNEAFVTGQLAARIVDAPKWWKDSDHGQDLEDPNVSMALYDQALLVEESFRKDVQKEAQVAKKALKEKKKEAPAQTVSEDGED